MLQQIRDRTSGLIAGFVVALVAIPFAFFGIESFNSGGGDPVVAEVGDQKIHDSQFRRQYDQRYQQLVQLMGENFRADMLDQNRLREAVLRDMTQETMLKQYTQKHGFQADDATLFAALSSEAAFQRDGRFDGDAYRDALQRVGFTADRYESQLRDNIEMNQMREAVVDTAFVVSAQAEQAARLQNQERLLEYALFEVARYRDRVEVTDADVQARYEETRDRYMAPERLKLAYIDLSLDALPEAAEPGEDVLKVLYEGEKDGRFTTQEERKASHILVSFGADKGAAKQKIEDLAKQLAGGASFAALAGEHSEDPGSKNDGGDLGWVRRGQMVKGFEDALFALDKGATSGPVETEFGWHLIHLDDLKPSVVRSLDEPEVRTELVTLFGARERQQRFQEMSDRLEQLAFENASSLEPVAEALELKVQTTEWFERGKGSGIAANEAVISAAFSPEVLQDGENSKPVAVGPTRMVVVRKAEYEAPRQRTLEEVAQTVRDALVNERASALVGQEAQEVLNAVRGGTPFQEIISAKNGELRNPGKIRRDNATVEAPVVEAAFRLPHPVDGKPSFGETTLPDGGRAVLVLTSVDVPEDVTVAGEVQKRRLRDQGAGAEFGAYMLAIEDAVGIEIRNAPVAATPSEED